jgi:hypothetical protein
LPHPGPFIQSQPHGPLPCNCVCRRPVHSVANRARSSLELDTFVSVSYSVFAVLRDPD